MQAITANMDTIACYPDPRARDLRRAMSEWVGLPEEYIVAGNGAVEIIYLLMKLLKPAQALIPAPTFNEYEIAVRVCGGAVKDLLLHEGKGFAIDKEEIYRQWEGAGVLFICNPNNPTGVLTRREDLRDIIQRAGLAGKTVVVDEAFMDFVADRESYSVADLVREYSNLFVLYSLTKFFAIPGLRLGIGLGSPEVIEKLNRIRDPWNVNCFAQLAGIASLGDREYIKTTLRYISAEKDRMFEEIGAVAGFRPLRPSANYIFVNVEETGYSSTEITRELGKNGILVRDCASYKNLRPVYIRVAVKKREENDRLIEALTQLGRK